MRRAVLVVLALLALLVVPTSASALTLGFNDRWDNNWPKVGRIHEVGGSRARVFVTVTRAVQEGESYWAWLDRQVQGMFAANVQPYFVLADVPSYGGQNSYVSSQWRQTAQQLVNRYPGIAVEIANEPNVPAYGAVSADRFADLFKRVYTAIRSQNAGTVVIAGAPARAAYPDGQAWATRFHDLTKNLSYQVAIHLYGGGLDANTRNYEFFRNLYPTRSGQDFWVTEMGVSANGGLDRQAQILSDSLRYLASRGTEQVSIHTFYTYICSQGWGILDCNDQPRPAYYAIQAAMAAVNG